MAAALAEVALAGQLCGGSSGGGSSGGSSSSGGGGVSIDDLDAELDTSLDDFDSRVGGSGGSSNIDVLDPMGGGGSTYDSSQAVYEELDSGGDSVAERAEQGPGGESSDGAASGESSAESSPAAALVTAGRAVLAVQRRHYPTTSATVRAIISSSGKSARRPCARATQCYAKNCGTNIAASRDRNEHHACTYCNPRKPNV